MKVVNLVSFCKRPWPTNTPVFLFTVSEIKKKMEKMGVIAYLHMWPKSNKSPIFVMIDHAAKSTFFE